MNPTVTGLSPLLRDWPCSRTWWSESSLELTDDESSHELTDAAISFDQILRSRILRGGSGERVASDIYPPVS